MEEREIQDPAGFLRTLGPRGEVLARQWADLELKAARTEHAESLAARLTQDKESLGRSLEALQERLEGMESLEEREIQLRVSEAVVAARAEELERSRAFMGEVLRSLAPGATMPA